MFVIHQLVLLSSLVLSILASNLEHDSSVTIRLQHALKFEKNPTWTDRGNITIHSLRTGQVEVDQNELKPDEQRLLSDLSARNSYYQVKSIVLSKDGTERTFISTVKACMLVESDLDDRLSVSLDYMGRVVGVSLVVASSSACEGVIVPRETLQYFNTVVFVRHSEDGPNPDVASFIQKIEKEKEAKEKGETKDNRSFLAKYWMYIVPLLIFMAISSAANPEAQQGQ
ncbi:unnamed protein product [Phyllotreta striolata]|uniref:ER membrane protein complex subunit 10 n=1 Tax=Phyllotreta striolata TaxID=444603 RepID=A0A9N9U039_PHYSR|nr:unnamed protein product [Phyllotreta striolata]